MSQNAYLAMIAKLAGGNVPGLAQLDAAGGLLVNQLGNNGVLAAAAKLFLGANQAGATLSNGLATVYTGLCLSNPAGSGKNLYVGRVSGACAVAVTGQIALGIISGFAVGGVTVHTTPVTPLPALVGNAAVPVAKVDAACTLVGTPAWLQWLNANTAANADTSFSVDLEGGIVIPPGGYVAIGSLLAAGPASGFVGSFEWNEF